MHPVIVGGSPGCGKTTLCRHLSQRDETGIHLQTDYFFRFIAHCLDPSKPESKAQNEAVIEAYCAAAKAFSEKGFAVYIDGVIGPWHHALITSALGPFHYILLHAPLPLTLKRVSQRQSQSSAHPSVVERMHPQFESALERYADNLVLTGDAEPDELMSIVLAKIQSGRCVVGAA